MTPTEPVRRIHVSTRGKGLAVGANEVTLVLLVPAALVGIRVGRDLGALIVGLMS